MNHNEISDSHIIIIKRVINNHGVLQSPITTIKQNKTNQSVKIFYVPRVTRFVKKDNNNSNN